MAVLRSRIAGMRWSPAILPKSTMGMTAAGHKRWRDRHDPANRDRAIAAMQRCVRTRTQSQNTAESPADGQMRQGFTQALRLIRVTNRAPHQSSIE
jgi:hypothetical protein